MSNYQTWNALNVASSDSGTDFQKIARDSNFHFKTYKGRVNWNQIEKLKIDRLIDEQNVSILGHNVDNVVNFDIESEFDVRILNTNFVKIFKLSQLTNDFLLHCKRHLSQQNYLLKVDLEKACKKVTMLKKENVELKKIIHWNKWRPSGCAGEGHDMENNAMCEICGKLFQFESYLIMHMNRRHPGVTSFQQFHRSESYITHYDKEPGECGAPSTSVGLPRDHPHRYMIELESLRKLINSKLGTNISRCNGSNITVESCEGVEMGRSMPTSVLGPQTMAPQGSREHQRLDNQGLGPQELQVLDHSDLGHNRMNDNFNEALVGDQGRVDRRVAERPISPPTCQKTTEGAAIEVTARHNDGASSNETISKEEYETHLNTVENAWKKQFQELDAKYQNEIRKLQKELKITIDDNQNTVKKLLSEKQEKERETEMESQQKEEEKKRANFKTAVIREMYVPDNNKVNNNNEMNDQIMDKSVQKINKDRDERNEEHEMVDRTKVVENNKEINDRKETKEVQLVPRFSNDPYVMDTQHDKNNKRIQNSEELNNILSSPINMPMKSVDVIVQSNNQVIKESRSLRGLTRQSSVFDLKRSKTKIDNSIKKDKNGITMSEKKATSEDHKIKFKEAFTAATKKVSPIVKTSDSNNMDPKEIAQTMNAGNFKSASNSTNCKESIKKSSNYDNILAYLNANDKQTEKQTNAIKSVNKDKDKHEPKTSSSFFCDIDTDIFDFNSKTPSDVFYNDDFAEKLSRHVAIDVESVKNIFNDRTFSMTSFPREKKDVSKSFDEGAIKTDGVNATNPFAIVETMLKDLDINQRLPRSKHVHKSISESSKFSSENQQSKMEKNMLFSKREESDPNENRSYQGKQSPMKQPLKHSEKYFGNVSAQTNEDPPKILTTSSSDMLDKVLNVINPDDVNPDSLFYDDIIGPSAMNPVESKDYFIANTQMKPVPLGSSSIMEQIRTKDLSIIEEETETDTSTKMDKKDDSSRHDSGSSSDESSAMNNSSETDQHNRRKEVDQTYDEDTSESEDDTLSNDEQDLQQIEHRTDDGKNDMDHQDSGSTVVAADQWNSSSAAGNERDEESLAFNTKDSHPYVETMVTIHQAPNETTLRTKNKDNTNNQDNEIVNNNNNMIESKNAKENIQTNKQNIKELNCGLNKETSQINLGNQQEILSNTTRENTNNFERRKTTSKELSNDIEEHNFETDLRERSLVRQEVIDKFDKVLKQLNLNPEWMSLPKHTFEQKMDIIMHDRLMKTKAIKNYENKKDAIKSKLESIWREKMQMEKEIHVDSQPNTVENKENDERFSNEAQGQCEDYGNSNVRFKKKNKAIHNEQPELNEKTKSLNKELESVLGLKKEKSETPTEISMGKKLGPHEHSLEKAKKKISFDEDFQKPRHQEANNFLSKEPSGHDSNLAPTTQISSKLRKNTIKNPDVVVILLKNENDSPDEDAKNVDEGSKSGISSQQKKSSWQLEQNIEPSGTAKSASIPKPGMTSETIQDMYHSEDILDRQTDYLQTNNFTSKQPIRKSSSRGYNILGKYIKTNGIKTTAIVKKRSSDSEVLDTTDKAKQNNQSRCKSTDFRDDNCSRPTHTIGNSKDDSNTIPKSSKTIESSHQEDMFLIKAPYDISTNATSESNFLIKEAKYNKGMYENKGTTSVNTSYSCLDPSNKTLTARKKLTTNQLGSNMVSNMVSSQANKLETNVWDSSNQMKSGDNSKTSNKNKLTHDTFEYQNRPYSQAYETKGDVGMENDTPMMGTIRRMITAADIREDSDSSSSFELDDFLQKNNLG
uniref:C2H2-type domain-containing protein n=1 Tax=Cacopsylla melanoneura TaxID=428564 RepID=A0A8D9B828_9HEMI